MKRIIILLLVFIAGFSTGLKSQVLNTSDGMINTGSSFFESHHACVTLDILESPDSREAMESFRNWVAKGRPDHPEMLSKQILSEIGERKDFRVTNFGSSGYSTKTFELRAIGNQALIWVDIDEFSSSKVTQEHVDAMLVSLEEETGAESYNPDAGIIDNNRLLFGNAPNVDNSGKVSILVYEILDEDGNSTIGGYFAPVNLSMTNPNSNRADIVYINSRLVYNPSSRITKLSILAHEDQHLVHANYGQLNRFQNEGQSELASAANGYPFRNATHLAVADEINVSIMQWRDGNGVLFDYSRAALFHDYLADRVGLEQAASLTRSSQTGLLAYQNILSPISVSFNEFLFDYHTATFLNDDSVQDGRYGFLGSWRSNTSITGFRQVNSPVLLDVEGESDLYFGGAEFISWFGVKDLQLDISAESGVLHRVFTKEMNSNTIDFMEISQGSTLISGEYESVVLMSVKNKFTLGNINNTPPSRYSYTASWDPLPIQIDNLRYFTQSEFLAELPGDPTDADRQNIQRYAQRFEPTVSGDIRSVTYFINGGSNAVVGSGTLQVSIHEAIPGGVEDDTGSIRQIPGLTLYNTEVSLSGIIPGVNSINVEDLGWSVESGKSYHIVFEVVDASSDARLEFLIDGGTATPNAPGYKSSYYLPTRSLIFIGGVANNWFRWGSRNNFLFEVRLIGEYDGPLVAPVFSVFPESHYTAVESNLFEVTVASTGEPEPVYQWRRNGITVPGVSGPTLRFNETSFTDAGQYTVRAANFAGSTPVATFEIEVIPNRFVLAQNYPNPFNPSTTIRFSITSPGTVNIGVYDVLGRNVANLLNNESLNAGEHFVNFDAVNLPSGMYLYRILFNPDSGGGQKSQTNKMLLVK